MFIIRESRFLFLIKLEWRSGDLNGADSVESPVQIYTMIAGGSRYCLVKLERLCWSVVELRWRYGACAGRQNSGFEARRRG